MKNYSLGFSDTRFNKSMMVKKEEQKFYTLYEDQKSLYILTPIPNANKKEIMTVMTPMGIVMMPYSSEDTKVNKIWYAQVGYKQQIKQLQKHLFVWFLLGILGAILLALLASWYTLRPLRSSLRLLEDFIKDIIHDLNTPLTSIMLSLKMIGVKSEEIDGKGKIQRVEKNIVEFTALSIKEASEFISNIQLTPKEEEIAGIVLKEIQARLSFMLNVGIDYLTLDRRANTLSGGEAQRIRLASQLGSKLVGAMYVLDEPTIGLHQRDNDRLIHTLKELRDLGNTIIVVEHDEDTILAADYLIEIGPKAGEHGGEVIVADYLDTLLKAKTNKSKSRTLAYLRGDVEIPVPEKRRDKEKGTILIRGGKKHSINNLSVDLPLGKFVTITGVSGSGKSTFMYEILHRNLRARYDRRYMTSHLYNCSRFTGTEYAGRSILIDQSPIGRTPRSNPATYTGAFTHIRDLFTATTEARARGWKPGRFSFNVKGGRCEVCQGNGLVAVEMHFLPTVYVECDLCRGKRFMKETLDVKYKDKSIYDVLQLTVDDALKFFKDIPAIHDRFKTLQEVGLGYLRLGQSATTLSGGEAQRIKVASELYRPFTTKTVYLLDEPTVGLHYDDVAKLIHILQELVRRGNSVVVIEHNLDLIKCSDYILDFGPDGGVGGGKLVAKGTPEQVANSKSHTAKYLKRVL